jgi:orotate phosphoribosyltransferase
MLTEKEALKMIESTGAVLTGHFVYTSGRHGDKYVNKDLVSAYPEILERLAIDLAEYFVKERIYVDVVVSAATGAISLGHCVARALPGKPKAVYTEEVKDEAGRKRRVFRRGYDEFITPSTKVLIVEDIITTGGTVNLQIEAIERCGGRVVGIGGLWKRGKDVSFDYPFFSLVNVAFDSYSPEECPLCKRNVPINTDVGKGKEYLAQKEASK